MKMLLSVLGRPSRCAGRSFFSTKKKQSLILHAAGVDRLGIVSDVTKVVIGQGGNIGASVAGRLGKNYFSLMMLVDNVENTDELKNLITAIPDLESAVFSVDPSAPEAVPPKLACRYHMSIVNILTCCRFNRLGRV